MLHAPRTNYCWYYIENVPGTTWVSSCTLPYKFIINSMGHACKGPFALLHQVFMKRCTMHHAPCAMHHASCTMHHAPCTMHHAPCTMHHAPCIMHHAPSSMHHALAPCTLHHARIIVRNLEKMLLELLRSIISHFIIKSL